MRSCSAKSPRANGWPGAISSVTIYTKSWPETAEPPVQLAITYQGLVTLFRNEKGYAAYTMGQAQSFGDDAMVLLGLRYIGGMEHWFFFYVLKTRGIYNVALNAEQIAALVPKRLSEPPPLALWNCSWPV